MNFNIYKKLNLSNFKALSIIALTFVNALYFNAAYSGDSTSQPTSVGNANPCPPGFVERIQNTGVNGTVDQYRAATGSGAPNIGGSGQLSSVQATEYSNKSVTAQNSICDPLSSIATLLSGPVNFGSIASGSPPVDRVLTFRNTGTANLTLSNAFTNLPGAVLVAGNTCINIAVNTNCTVTLRLPSTAATTFNQIASTQGAGSNAAFSITGTVLAPPPPPPVAAGEISDPIPSVSPLPVSPVPVCVVLANPRPQFCGTKTWVVPAGVTSFSAVAIGGGGSGGLRGTRRMNTTAGTDDERPGAGGGGALSYSNNIPVNAGDIVAINVGCGGLAIDGGTYPPIVHPVSGWPGLVGLEGADGGDSSVSINGTTVLLAKGGKGGFSNNIGALAVPFNWPNASLTPNGFGGLASEGVGQVRHSGGNGGLHGSDMNGSNWDGDAGGGGAAGYTANGGNGGAVRSVEYVDATIAAHNQILSAIRATWFPARARSSSGGGGAGGARLGPREFGGGGTGVYGLGQNGVVPLDMTPPSYTNSDFFLTGGSGGDNGGLMNAPYCVSSNGGYPGGGGTGSVNRRSNTTSALFPGHAGFGAHGAVRIVFPGTTRQFPSTNVGP